MGNREDLLAGARQAVLERGLAKVTARDIASAAGVSLAAIGYHFGSKDQLVTEAIALGMGSDIGDDLDIAINATAGRSLGDWLPELLSALTEVARRHRDSLLLSFENGMQIARDPAQQAFMAQATEGALQDMGATVRTAHPDLTADQAAVVGQLLFLLFQGMGVQQLIVPDAPPLDGAALVDALEALRGSRSGG
ncbi:TetR/AcrR family transcriptional regulator [Nocardia sp. NBC_00511]|uniref:TetR/AcrR family transcriptional regulator n=1 Tax=Nocardia sp. NBC_00511 TaxID=2903591 RepID=UPI0030DF7CE2